jgi:hypothetical protein
MHKNLFFLLFVILIAALSYWLGYSRGAIHRFIPNAENIRIALDAKTGQVCSTVPHPFDSEASLPKCKDLK